MSAPLSHEHDNPGAMGTPEPQEGSEAVSAGHSTYGVLRDLYDPGELTSFIAYADPDKVVWHNEEYMILETGKDAYQIYQRIPGWERLPRGNGTITWYKSIKAAKKAIGEL